MSGTARMDIALKGGLGNFALDVAFAAPMDGVTALFGPSGAGKSTVIRAVAGLARLQGHVRIGGASWQESARRLFLPPHKRPIGYVFQEASLFPHLSVAQNLDFGRKRVKRQGRPLRQDREALIELLRLGPLLSRAPATLSGGERQRVALGRALLAEPELLLLDEPLAALDRASKLDILPYLAEVGRSLSVPMLYVTHDLDEVARLAGHMILIRNGRVVQQGAATGILERLDLGTAATDPDTGVVVPARVTRQDADYALTRLDMEGQTLSLPALDLAVGTEVRLRIRARDVSLALTPPVGTSIRNILHGVVAEIVPAEDNSFADVLVQVGAARIRSRITRESVDLLALREGLTVHALVKGMSFDG